MDLSQVIEIITNNSPLGWIAQKELAPIKREKYTLQEIQKKNPKEASVLIVLYEKNTRFFFLL